jgi:hypothetical protein
VGHYPHGDALDAINTARQRRNDGAELSWAPILGQWEITGTSQTFPGAGQNAFAHGQLFPVGLAVSNKTLQNGICKVRIQFSAPFGGTEQAGGIVIGYRSAEQHYIFAELGAARSAYSIGEYASGLGWRPLVATGELKNLKNNREYMLQVNLSGQELKVLVDGVPVLQDLLSQPLEGRQVGLTAAGTQSVYSPILLFAATSRGPLW